MKLTPAPVSTRGRGTSCAQACASCPVPSTTPRPTRRLADTVAELDSVRGTGGNHAFYLSIPPSYFPVVAKHLSDTGLNKRQGREWRRVIIEKPFGHNLESARELSDVISQIFDEQDVFRIDHYLGKETVQNIMAMRFANAMFEPLWKANYVDSVQITMAEDIGIGTRAGYYDGIGAARDTSKTTCSNSWR